MNIRLFPAALALAVAACSPPPPTPTPTPTPSAPAKPPGAEEAVTPGAGWDDGDPLVRGANRFGAALYGRLKAGKGNLLFSPYSLHTALAMLSAGTAGKTLTELEQVLGLPPQAQLHPAARALASALETRQKGLTLTAASSAWPAAERTVRPDFLRLLRTEYGAEATTLDFTQREAARRDINTWASKKTAGLIPELLGEPPPAASALCLANAIHFKGAWVHAFRKDATAPGDFHTPDGTRRTPFMRLAAKLRAGTVGPAEVVELPFVGDGLRLVIAAPKVGQTLDSVERALISGRLTAGLAGLNAEKVNLALPRFRLSCAPQVTEHLQALGLVDVFTLGADFSRAFSDDLPTSLDSVIHKAVMEVNEEGAEAAAATAVFAYTRGGGGPWHFQLDRPFVFMLRDTGTWTVLLVGRVVDPTKG